MAISKFSTGIAAILAAIPTSYGQLGSGDVCPIRDSLDRLSPEDRKQVTFDIRVANAQAEFDTGPTCHITNGDESLVPGFVGQFHKALPHDGLGNVDPEAYERLLECIFSSDINVCESIPSGDTDSDGGARLVDPIGGTVHQIFGPDSDNVFIATPSSVLSAELAAQMAEVYWMALSRDVLFVNYDSDPVTIAAAANLEQMPELVGFDLSIGDDGVINPGRDLFRTNWPGVASGGVVSQFLLQNFILDGINVVARQETFPAGVDYMTKFQDWLDVQNGASDVMTELDTTGRFIRNGRDLASLAFRDFVNSESIRALSIMDSNNIIGLNGPYRNSLRQVGFPTFGIVHIIAALGNFNSATRQAWYAKWNVHRVLRPEAYGGLVQNTLSGEQITELDPLILDNQELLDRIADHNSLFDPQGPKSYLLPMAVAEGSPTHPAYPSGHAINLGAFATILKAFLGFESGQRCFENPVISSDDGLSLEADENTYAQLDTCTTSEDVETLGITYEGEINKMASNVIIGRSHLGVHYRMDGTDGARMGETTAIRNLQEELTSLPQARDASLDDDVVLVDDDVVLSYDFSTNYDFDEGSIPIATFRFRLFSGTMIELFPDGTYMLGDVLCTGRYTGEDACQNEVAFDEAQYATETTTSIISSSLGSSVSA